MEPSRRNVVKYELNLKSAPFGLQAICVAFGSLVLVPLLTGLSPSVALFTSGLGTLAFQIITKGKVPLFLASSFAYIGAIQYGVQHWGIEKTQSGLMAAGIVQIIFALLIMKFGYKVIKKILPPIVIGPVIMVIGLSLAPIGVNMARGLPGTENPINENYSLIVSCITLIVAMWSVMHKGWLKLFPIIVAIAVGYAISAALGIVNYQTIHDNAWLATPDFTMPVFDLTAILYMIPFAIAPTIEHIGDVSAISSATGENYIKDPGLHSTLFGDGFATSIAGIFGGPPNTSYSEVTGAVILTKQFNPAIMTWASIVAIIFAFIGKLSGVLASIPVPVIGGMMILLFGMITTVGIKELHKAGKHDLDKNRNMIIIAVILVFGIGGMTLGNETFKIAGIGLAAVTGILLNLILPKGDDNDDNLKAVDL